MALLMLAVIGWKFLAAFAIMAAILGIVAYRERRAGRPFKGQFGGFMRVRSSSINPYGSAYCIVSDICGAVF